GGEQEFWIVSYLSQPEARDFRPDVLIEGSVDLDGVEIARQFSQRVKASALQLGIDDSIPVLIRPTGGSTVQILGEGHDSTFILLFFSHQYSRRKGENQEGGFFFAPPVTLQGPGTLSMQIPVTTADASPYHAKSVRLFYLVACPSDTYS